MAKHKIATKRPKSGVKIHTAQTGHYLVHTSRISNGGRTHQRGTAARLVQAWIDADEVDKQEQRESGEILQRALERSETLR